jgi:hypothetical protein
MVRCYEWNWSWLRKWRAKRLFSVIFPLQLWNGKWWVRPAALVLAQSPCHACASRLLAKLFLVVKFPFKGNLNQVTLDQIESFRVKLCQIYQIDFLKTHKSKIKLTKKNLCLRIPFSSKVISGCEVFLYKITWIRRFFFSFS